MTHRFALEIRVLIDVPFPGLFRLTPLEVDMGAPIVNDWQRALVVIEAFIATSCVNGTVIFREPSAGLLVAWSDAHNDEQTADACGVVYGGALARVVHVNTERNEPISVPPNIKPNEP